MTHLKTSAHLLVELEARLDNNTQQQLAERLGISKQYLSDIFRGRRGISDQVASKLGYERVVRWRRTKK